MKKILVVEDASSLRKDIMEMLSFEGYSVQGAENGLIALERVHSFVPDLILSDIMMPEMDGIELLRRIRNDPVTSAIPIIMLTARTERMDRRACMNLGADDYLTKPFHAREVLDSIQARLRRIDQVLGIPTPKQSKRLIYHVFLSYARADSNIMSQVKAILSKQYLRVWTDESLKPGTQAWRDAIETSIRYSGCLVVIVSPDAKKSKWVNRELAYAEMCDVQIFPLLSKGEPDEVIPISLVSSQWLDIRANLESEVNKLIEAIRDHVGINFW